MEIIAASIAHLENVYELICELENDVLDKDDFSRIYRENLNDASIHYFLAVDGQTIIGFASLHIQKLLHHCALVGEIQEIIIAKNQQGSGAGTALFNKIKETATLNNCSLLEVSYGRGREKSHDFYLKQGMTKSHFKFTFKI